jgi:hypothetical protein
MTTPTPQEIEVKAREFWKEIPGYKNYSVSNRGRVRKLVFK